MEARDLRKQTGKNSPVATQFIKPFRWRSPLIEQQALWKTFSKGGQVITYI